ncbi:hypothetical protein C8F01DRAFT_1096122 [Mycena amicta]|nr:hypothetical protein C8F01DRAFT_1096122 [Mycena amicta]
MSVPVVSGPGPSLLTVSTELHDVKHSQLQAVSYNHPGNSAPVPTPLKASQSRPATPLGIPLTANFITLRTHQDQPVEQKQREVGVIESNSRQESYCDGDV